MGFKIAIVGAGPAGCMLARLLTHRADNIDVIVFEGEDSLDLRSQGGTLDLHVKTGQRALKEADLYDEFLEYARFDGEAMSLADKNLLCYVKVGGNSAKSTTGRPEIDRPKLRHILFESLPQHTVKWRHKLIQVERNESAGDFILHFANQPSQTGFDLVVGADGAWSKVRPVLSPTKPFFSGIAGHAFKIPDAQIASPLEYDLVNRGSLFAWSHGKSIMAQYMGDGSLNVGTWALRPEDWRKQCGYDVHDAKATKEACVQEYADWDPRLVSFTQRAEDHVVPRDLYMLPVDHRWKHMQGVTLIGDAAHLMGHHHFHDQSHECLHPSTWAKILPLGTYGAYARTIPALMTDIGEIQVLTSLRAIESAAVQTIHRTPFAGEGVNLSLEDCVELANAIKKSASVAELDQNVRSFEEDMFSRAKKTAQLTADMMHAMFFAPDSPRNGIERYILRAAEDELGWWLTKLCTPLVFAYFFVFRLIW